MNVNLSLKMAAATVGSRHSVCGALPPSAHWRAFWSLALEMLLEVTAEATEQVTHWDRKHAVQLSQPLLLCV